jgi:putative nucleotidyltransferase with HDIG domain
MSKGSPSVLLKEKLDASIALVPNLPPSPRLMIKLLEVFKQPDQCIEEVVIWISHDPSCTVEVLKHCNSAYFAGKKPAEDIFEAVSRLGFLEVYSVIAGMFTTETMSLAAAGTEGGYVEGLWRHSVAVAVAARVLAKEVDESDPAAFTAGLLHDIGKVVMVSADRDRYAYAVLGAGVHKKPVTASEKELFGFDHCEVGARLLEKWNLPENIIAAVQCHHDLSAAKPFERLAACVQLANLIAHQTGENLADVPEELQNVEESMAILQLTGKDISGMLPGMREGLALAKALMPA